MDDPAPLTPTSDEALLDACAREPIHLPGAIQPHGVLLGFNPARAVVQVASANAEAFFGQGRVVGAALGDLLGPEGAARVQLMRAGDESFDGRRVEALGLPDGSVCEAVYSESDGLALLELMREEGAPDGGLLALRIQTAVNRLLHAPDAEGLLQQAADEVRALTGFDRVDVYRFNEDWNGEVVAEARADSMPAYLGLHFPAGDIPPQARALYARNRLRLIPDAAYTPVPIVPDRHPDTGAPLDLSMSVLRSVSPVHLEYLANMGVQASMSVSILRDGALWGLFACHHRTARQVSFHLQVGCVVLSQVLGMLLDRQYATEDERARAERQRHMARLLDGLLRAESVVEGLAAHARPLMALVGASGIGICGGGEVVVHGQTPPAEAVARLCEWLHAESEEDVFATNTLGRLYPEGADLAGVASGVLAVTLARRRGHTILWFRPEQPREVSWAGSPEKTVRESSDGSARLHPRVSFAAWQTLLRGQSRPWTATEQATAAELRQLVLDLVYERVEAIQRLNARLRRSNEALESRNRELQDFAFVASHDLREPLRKIRAFSDLLRQDYGAQLPQEAQGYVERVEAASIRAMQLLDDLLLLSRVSTRGKAFTPASLGDALVSVRDDLEVMIGESGATLEVPQTWPALHADQAQLAQALRLIVENALMYRSPERAPRVQVEAFTRPGDEEGDPERVVVRIHDNGIGFEERFAERIFKPFERLHARTKYPGTGMGLAIVRRIAERHGGRVRAWSVSGEGSVFELDLPAWHDHVPGDAPDVS